jgi:hydroxyacylglutathione hydrolase
MEEGAKFFIYRIVNSHLKSNTYIIYNDENVIVTIIDPGEIISEKLLNLLTLKKNSEFSVFLTHKHYDHIYGLKALCSSYKVKVFLNEKCFENINNSKKNLSEFLDMEKINNNLPSSVYLVHDHEEVFLHKLKFVFYFTPGHSEGGICFGVDKYFFSGDTVMQYKVPTNLPGGSKVELNKTKMKLKTILPNYDWILPGHGDRYNLIK